MKAVMQGLHAEHENIARILDLLEREIGRFTVDERPDYELIDDMLNYFLNFPDLHHHPKEDLIFQKLLIRDAGAAGEVGNLQEEHRKLTGLTRRFATAVNNVELEAEMLRDQVAQLAQDFLDAYRAHLEMEEAVFFPAAESAFRPEDWADITMAVSDMEDPVFGAKVEKRFLNLRNEILSAA